MASLNTNMQHYQQCQSQGHDKNFLCLVCIDPLCQQKGLICQICANLNHPRHEIVQLNNFIIQYKEMLQLSNKNENLLNDYKTIQSFQAEIKKQLTDFLKTLNEETNKMLERLNNQFLADQSQIDAVKNIEGKYLQHLHNLDQNKFQNHLEAMQTVMELIQRIRTLGGQRFQLVDISIQNSLKIQNIIKLTSSLKQNIFSETQRIVRDVLQYYDIVIKFLATNAQMINQQVEQTNIINQMNQLQVNQLNNNLYTNQALASQLYPLNTPIMPLNNTLLPLNNSILPINNQIYPLTPMSNNPYFNQSAIFRPSFNYQTRTSPTRSMDREIYEMERLNNRSVSPFREQTNRLNINQFQTHRPSNYFNDWDYNSNLPLYQQNYQQNQLNYSQINNSRMQNNQSASFSNNRQNVNNSIIENQNNINIQNQSLINNNQLQPNRQHINYFQQPGFLSPIDNEFSVNTPAYYRPDDPYFSRDNRFNKNLNQFSHRSIQHHSVDAGLDQSKLVNAHRLCWKAHNFAVKDLVFLDSDKIASASSDYSIKIWEKTEGKLLTTLEGHTRDIEVLTYQSSLRILASGGIDRTIRIWRPVPSWQCVNIMKGHNDTIKALIFYNDRILVSGSIDQTIKFWDVEKCICQRTINSPDGAIYSLLIRKDQYIASGCSTCIVVWDYNKYQLIKNIQAHKSNVTKLLIVKKSNEQDLLISSSIDQSIRIWEADSFTPLKQLEESLPIYSICYIREYDYLVTALQGYKGEGKIGIWTLDFYKKIKELNENSSGVYQILWDSVNKALFSCHENKTIEYNKLLGIITI